MPVNLLRLLRFPGFPYFKPNPMSSVADPTASLPSEYTLDMLDQVPRDKPVYGVVGHPVSHAMSPVLQNAAFQATGTPGRYFRFHILPGELSAAVEQFKKLGFRGWNCTLPHKMEMFRLVDMPEPAKLFEAINTVIVRRVDGKLTGYNTDGLGWTEALAETFKIDSVNKRSQMRIMILGLGGAGTTLAIQAASDFYREVVLANRTPGKAEHLLARLKDHYRETAFSAVSLDVPAIQNKLKNVDLLVNCTSIHASAGIATLCFPPGSHHPHLKVYDTNYKPLDTPLMQTARAAGACAENGLSMLLHQGAQAFKIWTGNEAPLDVMRAALMKAVTPSS